MTVNLPSTSPEAKTALFRVYYTPPTPCTNTSSSAFQTSTSLPSPPTTFSLAPATAPWLKSPAVIRNESSRGVVLVGVHGAGYSGLSFACFAKEVLEREGGKVGVLAYDARGHGTWGISQNSSLFDLLRRYELIDRPCD